MKNKINYLDGKITLVSTGFLRLRGGRDFLLTVDKLVNTLDSNVFKKLGKISPILHTKRMAKH